MGTMPIKPQRARTWAARARALATGLGLMAGVLTGVTTATPALAGTMPAGFHAPSTGVDWLAGASDTEIDATFAKAKADNKPLLIYWGATWCPPCNQLKATLFNRPDFQARAKNFHAVYVDGDFPNAQKIGKRFKVMGYPTVILFNPRGQELTRLPGEVEAPVMMRVLDMGLSGGRPVKAVLADALAGKPMTASDWRLLAYYSWEVDEGVVLEAKQVPATLQTLAAKVPAAQQADLGTRLWLKAVALRAQSEDSKDSRNSTPGESERLLKLLADGAQVRQQMDALTGYTDDLARALAPQAGSARERFVTAYKAALRALGQDTSLSRIDRLNVLLARVELARLDQGDEVLRPKLPSTLVEQVEADVASIDQQATDPYERQALITTAGHVLARAGLWAQSDALLKASVAKSHSPYYIMSALGSNAKAQGRKAEALDWYAKAFETSVGPATRLQWGASYLHALISLTPDDSQKIEATAAKLVAEAAKQPAAFYERSARAMQRMGKSLTQWNAGGRHEAVLSKLRAQLAPVCQGLPAADGQKATCDTLLAAEAA